MLIFFAFACFLHPPLNNFFPANQQLETTPDAGTERGVLLERARQDWRDMKVCQNVSSFKFGLQRAFAIVLISGEKEGKVDSEGDEGVPRLRGEGGRLQGQTPRVQPSKCQVILDTGGTEDPGQVRTLKHIK